MKAGPGCAATIRGVRGRGQYGEGGGGETFSETSRAASEAAAQGVQEEGVYGVTC